MPTNCTNCDNESRRTDFAGNPYCTDCYSCTYSSCESCGAELANNETRLTRTGDVTCESCIELRRIECECCNAEMDRCDSFQLEHGERVCHTCHDEMTIECTDCGVRFSGDDDSERPFCRNCINRDEWNNFGFHVVEPGYDQIRSKRKFGVEIETSACDDHKSIRSDTVFGCKTDGSVDGKEFVSPVLYGDEGLDEVRKICGHARRLGWEIDSACGLHTHFDLSNESDENCFKVAHAYMHTYDFWTTFITNARKRNYYCAKHTYGPADLAGYSESFYDWVCTYANEKYTWANFGAYTRFKTIEIRHHAASLNPTKLCNWIKAHTRFIDNVVSMSIPEINRALAGRSVYDQFNIVKAWWDDAELADHYKERAALFGKPITNPVLAAAMS